uniref:AlNc14C19G1967 protein n=1 Tax=Albugo laibachii Nc14 TaxID=890382 RepID=F0W4Z7_9STRA|nr:AlNc14C19G1967 [Albugo laibachii Nc14]|eukprot:CCA16187.1 AlNc14C19G1967 [Albugo laibachii Nc14]
MDIVTTDGNIREFVYSVSGTKFFFSKLESYCSGRRACGRRMLTDIAIPKEKVVQLPSQVSSNPQFLCLLRGALIHSISCAKCLKESNDSDVMGNFLVEDFSPHSRFHLYVLHTSKNPKEIITSCRWDSRCVGATVELIREACNSFGRDLLALDRSPPDLSSPGLAGVKVHDDGHPYEVRKYGLLKRGISIDQFLKLDLWCFYAQNAGNVRQFCLACVSSAGKNKKISISIERILNDQNVSPTHPYQINIERVLIFITSCSHFALLNSFLFVLLGSYSWAVAVGAFYTSTVRLPWLTLISVWRIVTRQDDWSKSGSGMSLLKTDFTFSSDKGCSNGGFSNGKYSG